MPYCSCSRSSERTVILTDTLDYAEVSIERFEDQKHFQFIRTVDVYVYIEKESVYNIKKDTRFSFTNTHERFFSTVTRDVSLKIIPRRRDRPLSTLLFNIHHHCYYYLIISLRCPSVLTRVPERTSCLRKYPRISVRVEREKRDSSIASRTYRR